MADLILNGRFLSRPPTGVDRVAAELTAALMARGLPGRFGALRVSRPGRYPLPGQIWEQTALARRDPRDWLLSLCNIGPVLRARQVVMLHDAQAFLQPGSYTPAFRAWYHLALPRLARRAAMVLTVSRHARAELEACGIVPPGKARVVPNGGDHILRVPPDPGTLRHRGLRPQGYILAIGSLAPHKNLATLIAAARARTRPSLPLVIAGGGDLSVFRDHGITPAPDVRLLGRVSDGELRALYDNALALAFPSRAEGFGLPPLEAMFCGCPVIATTAGAVPWICGDAALPVAPDNVCGWRAAMERVAGDPALRARMRAQGYARAARFTWAAAADRLAGCLEGLPD